MTPAWSPRSGTTSSSSETRACPQTASRCVCARAGGARHHTPCAPLPTHHNRARPAKHPPIHIPLQIWPYGIYPTFFSDRSSLVSEDLSTQAYDALLRMKNPDTGVMLVNPEDGVIQGAHRRRARGVPFLFLFLVGGGAWALGWGVG